MNVIEQMLEKIVNSWVGCEYKAVDEMLDIGEVLRKQFTEVLAALKAAEPIGYIDRKDLARLSNYKATIWPGSNEIDAVAVYIHPIPQAAQPVGEWNAAIEALEVYANPKNWICDNRGIARIWNEPDSSTPDCYPGFEYAMNALEKIHSLKHQPSEVSEQAAQPYTSPGGYADVPEMRFGNIGEAEKMQVKGNAASLTSDGAEVKEVQDQSLPAAVGAEPVDEWHWMTHPTRNDGKPIPVQFGKYEDGVVWYRPFNTNLTEFEWDIRSPEWKIVTPPESNARVPVGIATAMPGASGFTMAAFEAAKVPAGTKVYIASNARVPDDSALQFANHIINGVFEGGDWDGGDLQDLAVQHGLLKPEEMAAPCREEGCSCAQNGAEFPTICYRKTYKIAADPAKEGE